MKLIVDVNNNVSFANLNLLHKLTFALGQQMVLLVPKFQLFLLLVVHLYFNLSSNYFKSIAYFKF